MDSTFDDISKILASYVPKLLGAAAILVIGWLVARTIGAIFSVSGLFARSAPLLDQH